MLLAALVVLPSAPASARGGACEAMRQACLSAGFVRGRPPGMRLVVDCLDPVLAGKAAGNLPAVDPSWIARCAAEGRSSGNLTAAPMTNGAPAAGPPPEPVGPLPEGAVRGANIVLILTDDFSMSLMGGDRGTLAQTMPNLAR